MLNKFDKLFEKYLPEEKQKGVDGKACWKGYRRQGTKKKGDKTVDNCVKVGEEVVGRARPKADRTRLSDEFKQQLLDHGMNMYQHY